jgi:hypothetical protein
MEFRRAFDPIRSLEAAWNVLKRAPAPLLVGATVLFVVSVGFQVSIRLPLLGLEDGGPLVVSLFGVALVGSLAMLVIQALFQISLACTSESIVVRGEAEVAEAFRPKGRLLSMVLLYLLQIVILFLATLPVAGVALGAGLLIGGISGEEAAGVLTGFGVFVLLSPIPIYVGLGLALSPYAVALDDAAPMEAVRSSWGRVRGNRWRMLLFHVVMAVVGFLGMLACCIGTIPATALITAAWSESYLRLVRPDSEQAAWWATTGDEPELV